MAFKQKAIAFIIKEAIKYVRKDYDKNLFKLIDFGDKLVKEEIHHKVLRGLKERLSRPGNEWATLIKRIVMDTDPDVIQKLIPPFINSVVKSYDRRKAAMIEHGCNIPWAILIDVTTACNLKCTGCWAAQYGNHLQMTYDDINKVIKEGKELGTYVYLYTGGEPLVRKNDLIRICKENPDCLFITFTNGTLCDDAFADELKKVGNMFLTISIEGNEETTDGRRGKGTYKAVISAMERLKKRGIPFGSSLCYTKANADVIASDEYADFLISQGVLFAWYFTFVPVGCGSTPELMATAEQREKMYNQIRKWRFKEVKPMFTIDFFNDGEYVGGCVAGGKQYFHISANGDCEPCVFAHYSNVNIKDEDKHVIDALKSPIFMAYKARQPFSDNMLRACPVMDNPGAIKKMVRESGAKSTDLQSPENVEDLFAKTVDVAKKWKDTADRMANDYGFVKWHIRSVDIYKGYESEHIKDYEDFE